MSSRYQMAISVFEYNDVFKEDKGGMLAGKLKLTDQNILFKNSKTGKVEQINNGDVASVSWQRLAAGYGIRVNASNGVVYRFGGFVNDEAEREKLKDFFKEYYKVDLVNRELSLTGRNWGTAKFEDSAMSFDIDKHAAFDIPLAYVSSCTTTKNEVTMEFHQNDDTAISLMEMRFYIPTDANSNEDPVENFRANVMSKASIIQATGDAIATFNDIQCLTPRGRYDIKIFSTFIQLHGKTFDYKIPISTVLRIFLLPHKDGRQIHFVLSLDPPIKQGQTRYHFLILLFNKEEEDTVKLSMSEEELKERYEGKLEKELSGPVFETISRIVKAVVQRKVTTPGNYKSQNGTPAISCSYKSGYGLFYALEKGFIFVHKPTVHIRFDEISSVNFARSGGSTRSFDVEVELKNGLMHTFSSIEKDEYGRLYEYVKGKGLRINSKTRGADGHTGGADDMLDSDGDDDEPDAYLARVKNEARQRDDDDDESDDDDFNPDKASGGSDVAEEFDTDHESDSEEEEGEDGEKKKKKKTKTVAEPGMKREKKEKSDGGDKKRKKKGKKDANAPKRPQTAFFLWLNENREKIKEDNPGISVTEIAKKAGEIWKTISDKSVWEKRNEEAVEKYKRDLAEYEANKKSDDEGGDDEKPKKKASSSAKKSSKSTSSPSKSGAFKSKEYVSDSSDSNEDDDKKKKKKPSPSKGKDKKKDESDLEEGLKSDVEEEILDSPEASSNSGKSDSEEEESMDED